jgi:hypothetical protein
MQDSRSPSLPPAPPMRTPVVLSSHIPHPKRPNKGITDIQRKALRLFLSNTRPQPTQKLALRGLKTNSTELSIGRRFRVYFRLDMII